MAASFINRPVIYCLIVTLAILAIAGGYMTVRHREQVTAKRELAAWLMIAEVNMYLSTPLISSEHSLMQVGPFKSDDEAIKVCSDAIALWPEYAEAYEARAALYERTRRYDFAKRDRIAAASHPKQTPRMVP